MLDWLKDKKIDKATKVAHMKKQKEKREEERKAGVKNRTLDDTKGYIKQDTITSNETLLKTGFVDFETWAAPKLICKFFKTADEAKAAFMKVVQDPSNQPYQHPETDQWYVKIFKGSISYRGPPRSCGAV